MQSLSVTMPPSPDEVVPRYPAVSPVIVHLPVESFRPSPPERPTVPVSAGHKERSWD